LILSGQAIAVLGGIPHPMKPCDASWVPAGEPYFFKSASHTEKLRIFWTYASIDATRTRMSAGDARTIAAKHLKLA
jgi:putative monooxygenase